MFQYDVIYIIPPYSVKEKKWTCEKSLKNRRTIQREGTIVSKSDLCDNFSIMDSIERKINTLKEMFSSFLTPEKKYQKIIELGCGLDNLADDKKIPENIVQGCQSTVFLHSFLENGQLYFQAEADALISAGLAALLIFVYSGETPETILKSDPSFLEDLGIANNLTLNRANGLYSIHLRMKQDSLKLHMCSGL